MLNVKLEKKEMLTTEVKGLYISADCSMFPIFWSVFVM